MRLAPKDISVVVHGPVIGTPRDAPERRATLRCLESVRRHLPGAQLILSTWTGSDVAGLPLDQLVESADPGALEYRDFAGVYNNVNRMIVATKAGLAAAAGRYLLRLRSDLLLTGTGFLDYFDRFPARSDWSVLQSKVVVLNVFSRVPGLLYGYPFHPSDWMHFGLRDDVARIWDIPPAPEPDTTHWFMNRPRPDNDPLPRSLTRYTPEQYVWLTFLRKSLDVRFEHQWDVSPRTVRETEKSFGSNLVIVTMAQANVHLEKYRFDFRAGPSKWLLWGPGTCYTHGLWLGNYETHCLKRRLSPRAAYRLQRPAVTSLYNILAWRNRMRGAMAA